MPENYDVSIFFTSSPAWLQNQRIISPRLLFQRTI